MRMAIKSESVFKKITAYSLLLFTIVLLSLGSPISKNQTVLFTFLFILITFNIASLNVLKFKKIDLIAILILLFWLSLNILSTFFNNSSFDLNGIIGYMTIFLISYTLIRYIGFTFMFKFEKVVYILSFTSLIIFFLNCIFPSFFVSLSPIFAPYTDPFYTDRFNNYWYAFIYTHDVIVESVTLFDLRNSGFMWEPGAFAMILAIMILYNWFTNQIKFSTKIIIYFAALISTFSTAGYLALFNLVLIYVYNRNKNESKQTIFIILFILSVVIYPIITNTEFIGGKINSYLEENQKKELNFDTNKDIFEINRYSAFLIKSYRFIQYPLGYGIVKPNLNNEIINKTDGVNGLGEILVRWGLIGFIFTIYSIFHFIVFFNRYNYPKFIVFLSVTVFITLFFSNPIENHYIIYFIILYPYTIDPNILKRKNKLYVSQNKTLKVKNFNNKS